ncbi:MAG TPA: DUF11 domain-containing protein [Vicinamibacterales bacterium]|nr:DUF11 domain-containing protein [Vicinamibacterales bacterium]
MSRSIPHWILLLILAVATVVIIASPAFAQPFNSTAIAEVGHDTSPTLESMTGGGKNTQSCAQQPAQVLPNATGITIDQNFCGYTPAPQTLCSGGVCVIASDNSGAAGPNHYFQHENYSAVIFDKTGQVVLGPFSTASFWNGFTSPNSTCSLGWSDSIVLYDHDAQRWFVSRFAAVANSDGTTSWYQCFAISTTTDPTGQYHRYVFAIDAKDWNDYPKFGIWPDAYYMTANNRFDVNNATAPIAHFIVAFERSAMLAGQVAREIIFKIDNAGRRAHILPADWDGNTAPPAGSPNYLARPLDTNLGWPASAMEIWTAQINWTAGTGVLNLQTTLPQNAFSSAICNMSQNCIPQPGTTQRLDPLAFGMMMYRLAYRNFGDHESLVFTQTVEVSDFDDHAGIRWYELRRSSGSWSLFQQSTFAPDSDHRWMGSIAMDRFGNMAMGYNVSSSATFPGIRIAGRLPGDPVNQITEAVNLEPGLGSETGTVFFADYAQTSLDPLDDCTFWYAGTYQPATANNLQFSWATKIASFRFPNCVANLSVTKTRSPSGAITAGTNVTYSVTVKNGGPADAGNVTLTDTLAAGTGFVSVSAPAGWTCTTPAAGQAGAVTCKTTKLANGASVAITIVASVNCSTPNDTSISNSASVSSETPPDPDHTNDSDSVSFTVFNPVPVVTASTAVGLLPQDNHDLVSVGLSALATDGACPAPTTFSVQVFGNEDDEDPTGAVFSPDAADIAVETLRLREERVAQGNGRVYLIVVKATDTAGGTGFATVTVVVPKSSSPENIDAVNEQAAMAKSYADNHGGAPPAGYVLIGDGPVIGSKQ